MVDSARFWGRAIKRLVTGAIAVVLIGTTAFAADMAVKAPPRAVAPAPVYNWTGFYAGLNAGGDWADTNINYTASTFGFSGPAGASFLDANASGHLHTSGFTGGGQIGYNW